MSNIDTQEEENYTEDDEDYTEDDEEYTEDEEEYTENDKDRSALLAFYKSSGIEQEAPDWWNTDEPYWNWYGVETSNDDCFHSFHCFHFFHFFHIFHHIGHHSPFLGVHATKLCQHRRCCCNAE